MTNPLLLIDSRSRVTTGKRVVHAFPETPAGVLAAWAVVIQAEVADEADDYVGLYQPGDNLDEACAVFNDYWAEYGWYLDVYDDDWTLRDDCVSPEEVT